MKAPEPQRSFTQSIIGADRLDIDMLGAEKHSFGDVYHALVRMRWRSFFASFASVFVMFNLAFAGLYALDPSGLRDADRQTFGLFWEDFFFSVHTIATVGYGNVVPVSLYANVLVVLEITLGLLFIAISSGLMFARFSRPTARVLFSSVAIIKPFEGVPTLMFRVGNQRRNFILETSVRVALLRREMVDGNMMRRFYDVPLVRKSSLVFALTWLVMHRIDEASPLYGVDANAFQAGTDELVVLLTGTDASVIQPVHARHAYTASQIMFDHDFADVVGTGDDGRNQIDYRRFHDVVPRVAAN